MRIIAFGDIHMDLGRLPAITGLAAADLILLTGDLTNFGGHAEARSIIDRIAAVNPMVLAVPGNLDRAGVADYLDEKDINLHGSSRALNGLTIVGLGGSNPTPFNTPCEFGEEELAALLSAADVQADQSQPVILVSHPPPLNTNADRIGSGVHVGSSAVRRYIEERQPALCVTGHIHEARSKDMIGNTLILNPGTLAAGGWVEIEIKNGSVTARLMPA